MTSTSAPVLFVLGAGPGLALSVAHRFGREGYAVALVSRSANRHADYLASLADAGIDAAAFTADAADPTSLRAAIEAARARFGRIDVGYYGPAAAMPLTDITGLDADAAGAALAGVLPAIDFASVLLPELRERGDGGLLFAGGLSSVVPMPPLGGLALMSAALRTYAVTLHAALAPEGVYAGTLTIGGLIDRSDIHTAMTAGGQDFGVSAGLLDPDDLAELLWRLYRDRTEAETVVNALA
jgi:NAD(P)-dependent dehydrogenase (short-subunit alcohol dehydrogenase family)